jgi:hypothetical protein
MARLRASLREEGIERPSASDLVAAFASQIGVEHQTFEIAPPTPSAEPVMGVAVGPSPGDADGDGAERCSDCGRPVLQRDEPYWELNLIREVQRDADSVAVLNHRPLAVYCKPCAEARDVSKIHIPRRKGSAPETVDELVDVAPEDQGPNLRCRHYPAIGVAHWSVNVQRQVVDSLRLVRDRQGDWWRGTIKVLEAWGVPFCATCVTHVDLAHAEIPRRD